MIKQNIKLKSISKLENKVLFINNPNIGVIDIETYLSKDNTNKVYALGFKTVLDSKPIIYYINKEDLDSSKIVLSMVNELLRFKYNKITFYCHNLGGYDIVFILYRYNDINEDKYKISCILRDDKIIKLTISKDKHSFTILDSYCILTDSLSRLGKNFEVETIKSIFPYKFANEDLLFYKGKTPTINFYENISKEEYNKIYSNN